MPVFGEWMALSPTQCGSISRCRQHRPFDLAPLAIALSQSASNRGVPDGQFMTKESNFSYLFTRGNDQFSTFLVVTVLSQYVHHFETCIKLKSVTFLSNTFDAELGF